MKRFGAILAVLLCLATIQARADDDPALSKAANQAFLKANAAKPGVVTRPSGLQYNVVKSGAGPRTRATDIVQVEYVGSLINGKVFDRTQPGESARFPANRLIPGWTEALSLMRVGDMWHLVIPANLAYGAEGAGDGVIPPDQTLVFDMTLLGTQAVPTSGDPSE